MPDTAANHVLVSDLGGTRLRAAVVEASGSLVAKEVIPTPSRVLKKARGGTVVRQAHHERNL